MTVWVAPPAAAVTITVWLFMPEGPGSKVDFSRLRAHLPRNGSGVSADAGVIIVSAAAAVTSIALINVVDIDRAIRSPSLEVVLLRPSTSGVCAGAGKRS